MAPRPAAETLPLPTATLHPTPSGDPDPPRDFRSWASYYRDRALAAGRRARRPPSNRQPKWWKIQLFRGMVNDLRRRAPFYWSDWKDAWDYRVIPATVYMYFAKYDSPNVKPTNHISNCM